MRTAQELFDVVAMHLLKQGRKSMRALGNGQYRCAYRGQDGCRCAIGSLIPDDQYTPAMEGVTLEGVTDILRPSPLREELLANVALLDALQITHDAFEPESWNNKLRLVAKEHALHMQEVSDG